MEEQIEKTKSGENESKGPSKTSAAAPKFLYSSLASSATTPVWPPCPDHPEDLLDTWEPPSALPPSVAQPAVPVKNLAEAVSLHWWCQTLCLRSVCVAGFV